MEIAQDSDLYITKRECDNYQMRKLRYESPVRTVNTAHLHEKAIPIAVPALSTSDSDNQKCTSHNI